MKRILLQPAYVLHRRPYRESSFLVELFTPEHGRLTVVARGVRKARSSIQGLLQPFVPLLVSWSGKGELMTLAQVEANGPAVHLKGECLFAGFYLNELMMCLLQKWDPHLGLFQAYEIAINRLKSATLEQKTLRSFEKIMLEELGYGLFPKADVLLHQRFLPDKFYYFTVEQGFQLSEQNSAKSLLFAGQSLLDMAKEDWQRHETLQDAKRLTRLILTPLLGARQINSRRLFLQLDEEIKYAE